MPAPLTRLAEDIMLRLAGACQQHLDRSAAYIESIVAGLADVHALHRTLRKEPTDDRH